MCRRLRADNAVRAHAHPPGGAYSSGVHSSLRCTQRVAAWRDGGLGVDWTGGLAQGEQSCVASSQHKDAGPPYQWSKLAGMRIFQCAGVVWAILFILFWVMIGLAVSKANRCVYINNVCFDR